MFLTSWLMASKHASADRANNRLRVTFRPAVESLHCRDLMNATLAISDVILYETDFDGVTAQFTVTLSEPVNVAVSVDFATTDGTAKSKHDYVAAAGTLTFAPGELSKIINIAIVGDNKIEDTEGFTVNLSDAVNATIADSQGFCLIIDDDNQGSKGHNGGGKHDCDGGHTCK